MPALFPSAVVAAIQQRTSLAEVLLYILIPMATIIIGGSIASFLNIGPKVRSGVQHFAAGVVFYAVAVELLPGVIRQNVPLWVVVGFTSGVAAMFGLKWLTQAIGGSGQNAEKKLPAGLIVAVGIDSLLDGLLLGLGFAAGTKEGILLTIALAIENFFLSLSVGAALNRVKISRWVILAVSGGLALIFGVSGLIGASILGGLSGAALEAVLSFGVAALLYLVTEELLVDAHEGQETLLATTMFFVGFQLFLIIGLLA